MDMVSRTTDMVSRTNALKRTTLETLRPLIEARGPLALVHFPNSPNVGDSAIYLGQLACLRALGLPRPRFICDLRTYDRGALARAVGDGTILLTGGGNLGDVWDTVEDYREEIVRSFPGNPIVQLPQTVHFGSVPALDRARTVFDSHPNLTLLARDARSFETLRSHFRAQSLLCPDIAFCLGPLRRTRHPDRSILWLARTDHESAGDLPPDSPGLATDWLDESPTALLRLNYLLMGATLKPGLDRVARPLLAGTYQPLARQRLGRGIALLSSGKFVITDRLHGHILCVLLGIPHVILDNSYGKLSTYHRTWTAEVDGVHLADSPTDALRLARELVRASEAA